MLASIRALLGYSFLFLVIAASHIGQAAAQTAVSAYAGTYSGIYSGIDQGTWTATISSLGEVALTGHSSVTDTTFQGFRADFIKGSDGLFVFPVVLLTTNADGTTIDFNPDAATGKVSATWNNVQAGGGGSFDGTRDVATTTTAATTTTTATTTSTTATTVSGTTTTTLPVTGSFNVAAGWNLLGHGGDTPLAVATSFGDPSKVLSVWRWVAASSKWAFYTPALDQAGLETYATGKGYDILTTINPGDGFWVNAKLDHAVTFGTIQPLKLDATYLIQGWNLVGNGDNLLPAELDGALGGTASSPSFTSMWAWNSALSSWYFYAPTLARDGTLAGYLQTKGYQDFGNLKTGNGLGFWINNLASDTSGKGIRPRIGWEVSVTPGIYTWVMQLCYSLCKSVGNAIYEDVDPNDAVNGVTATFNGISYGDLTRTELAQVRNEATTALQNVLSNLWTATSTPSAAVIENVINGAMASATSAQDFKSRLVSGFTAAGFPKAAGDTTTGSTGSTDGTGSTVGSATSGYLCPTTKAVNDPDWIHTHGSYWAAASAHDQGLYAVEKQYCDVADRLCLLPGTNASNCPG